MIKGYKPYKEQKEVIEGVMSSDALYHTVVCGRQVGKTITLINLLLYYAINNPKSKVLWISPVYSQINKVMGQIMDALAPTQIMASANRSDYEIKLVNGSKIWFRSAERADTIRGLSINYLLVDEAQDLKTSDWQTSILPTITVSGKKIIIAGTPKKKNFFYDYFMMGKSNDYPNYKTYTFPSSASPYVSKDFLEEQRKSLPENVYKQEFEGIFQEQDGQVFRGLKSVLTNDSWPQRTPHANTYGGLDIGNREDYSVLTIIDELGRVLYIWRDRHMEYSRIVDKVVEICKHYGVRELLVETNGPGDVMFETIKKSFSKAVPLFQTNQTKENIVRRLMADIEDMNLELPSLDLFPPLGDELEIFEYEVLPSGKIRYSHPSGFHDDCVISLAIANSCRTNPKRGGGLKIQGIR